MSTRSNRRILAWMLPTGKFRRCPVSYQNHADDVQEHPSDFGIYEPPPYEFNWIQEALANGTMHISVDESRNYVEVSAQRDVFLDNKSELYGFLKYELDVLEDAEIYVNYWNPDNYFKVGPFERPIRLTMDRLF